MNAIFLASSDGIQQRGLQPDRLGAKKNGLKKKTEFSLTFSPRRPDMAASQKIDISQMTGPLYFPIFLGSASVLIRYSRVGQSAPA